MMPRHLLALVGGTATLPGHPLAHACGEGLWRHRLQSFHTARGVDRVRRPPQYFCSRCSSAVSSAQKHSRLAISVPGSRVRGVLTLMGFPGVPAPGIAGMTAVSAHLLTTIRQGTAGPENSVGKCCI